MPFLIIIPIVLIIILAVYLKRPETRGKRGENRVKWVIGETIENEQYVINDLIVSNNGNTTQIDHIVINPRGVFVIETKNYSGEIYGSENQREWTQVLAYGNVKNKLYNPSPAFLRGVPRRTADWTMVPECFASISPSSGEGSEKAERRTSTFTVMPDFSTEQ